MSEKGRGSLFRKYKGMKDPNMQRIGLFQETSPAQVLGMCCGKWKVCMGGAELKIAVNVVQRSLVYLRGDRELWSWGSTVSSAFEKLTVATLWRAESMDFRGLFNWSDFGGNRKRGIEDASAMVNWVKLDCDATDWDGEHGGRKWSFQWRKVRSFGCILGSNSWDLSLTEESKTFEWWFYGLSRTWCIKIQLYVKEKLRDNFLLYKMFFIRDRTKVLFYRLHTKGTVWFLTIINLLRKNILYGWCYDYNKLYLSFARFLS